MGKEIQRSIKFPVWLNELEVWDGLFWVGTGEKAWVEFEEAENGVDVGKAWAVEENGVEAGKVAGENGADGKACDCAFSWETFCDWNESKGLKLGGWKSCFGS